MRSTLQEIFLLTRVSEAELRSKETDLPDPRRWQPKKWPKMMMTCLSTEARKKTN